MRKFNIEFFVGVFLLIGILCLAYLSVRFARLEVLGSNGYEISALFSNCGGLKTGGSVMVAGVEIGRVRSISLDKFKANVVMSISPTVKIPDDSMASIKTKGLIGEKFVEVSPGPGEEHLGPGGTIQDTEPAMDIERLVSQFIHGKVDK
jgi:phospholipid/cholesterol/gamma-HCH transport system substrate-binding protein